MSGRKLGGGRILGSGKSLGAPTPQSMPARAVSPMPSDSSISLDSSAMSPPVVGGMSEFGRDIGASISMGTQRQATATSSALVCPICSEEMMTLLQLNRHIDDAHQELAEEEQDEVKTWFDKQVLKAKRFQPLSLLNQKLRGLEVFESNESTHLPAQSTASGKAPSDGQIDPDDLITRGHWQRTTMNDYCTDPTCGKGLGPINGSVNCRKCGRLFCEVHTMYQMKLSRSANHEPVRGYWARVCETCYVSREGYNDHNGVSIDHTSMFVSKRRERVDRQTLEISRLEKRLTKLTRLLSDPPEYLTDQNGSLISQVSYLSGQKNARKMIEQSVVTWEDDNQVSKCPFCQQEFGSWTFRRHHCRLCGRVVCADPQTGCSFDVGLNVASPNNPEKPPTAVNQSYPRQPGQVSIDVRMCRSCHHTVFSYRDFQSSITQKPPSQRAYETLRQFERGITSLLPSFHRALAALQPETLRNGEADLSKPPATHAQIQEAAKLRKRLVDAFAKYGEARNRMRDLKTDSDTTKRLQMAVYTYASQFIHVNMLPLKSLPQLLRGSSAKLAKARHAATHSSSSLRHSLLPSPSPSQTTPGGSQAETTTTTTSSQASGSTIVSQLETEEKDLRERLVVLEEQRFMVGEMVQRAKERRSFEEVGMLVRNGDELDGEIDELRRRIGQLEGKFQGVYANGHR